MSNILIFGGSGFLGRHLVEKLQGDHEIYAPSSIDCSLLSTASIRSWDDMISYGGKIEFDYIFHCANYFKAGNFENGGDEWLFNQTMNCSVLNYWSQYQFKAKLITFGSDACYSMFDNHIEDNYLKGEVNLDYQGYALAKRNLYEGLQQLSKQNFNLKYVHLILITLYGTYFELSDTHLIHDLTKKICNASMGRNKGQVEFWGSGLQMREITFIDDLVDNILSLAFSNISNEIFNLGSSKLRSIRYFVDEIVEIAGLDPTSVFFNKKISRGIAKKYLDSSKARQLFKDSGWTYKDTDLRESLVKVVSYYKEKMNEH